MCEQGTDRVTFKCLGCGQRFDAAQQYPSRHLSEFPVCSAACLHLACQVAQARMQHTSRWHWLTCTTHDCHECQSMAR